MRILANIWYQDVLVGIDPISGAIKRVYNLQDIYPIEKRHKDQADCLNGISVTGELPVDGNGLQVWVTGKLWPNMYRIQLIDDMLV
jgi:glutaminyl-peptide cyclotransferase